MEKCLALCAEMFWRWEMWDEIIFCRHSCLTSFVAGDGKKEFPSTSQKGPTAACRGQSSRFLLVFYVNLFRSIAKAFKLNQKLNFLRLLWNSPRVDWWNLNQKSPRRGKEAGVSEWFIGVQIGCGKIECCFTTLFRNLEPRARKRRQKFFQLIKKMFAMNCFSCEIFLLCGLLHSPSRGCVNSFNSMINLKRGRLKVKLKGSKGGSQGQREQHPAQENGFIVWLEWQRLPQPSNRDIVRHE